MKTNLALIGFMGTGKSVVGKLLAKKLGKTLLEVDELIEGRVGKKVSRIFKEEGEARFRELEIEVIKEIADEENIIISCGGGIVLNKINIKNLRRNSVIVLLTASPRVILERASKNTNRPLLNTSDKTEQITQLLKFREDFYKSAADFTIDTSNLSVAEVAEKIIQNLPKRKNSCS